MKAASGWSDVSVNRLLNFLHEKLPEGNGVPNTLYEAKKLLCPYELEYEKIHVCPNDCFIYRGGELKNVVECPICKTPRYKKIQKRKGGGDVIIGETMDKVPAKCIWYLPIIPRFERLFGNAEDAKNLTWHRDRDIPTDNVIRHVADGDQWKRVDSMYPEFGDDPRNLRLGLSTDGMNPFGNMSSKHSSWPVMLVIYNLPPYLCMKRKYVMMPLMISGPKQPGNDIDVFLQPLVDDLSILWSEGVLVKDAFRNDKPFNLKAMLFWTVTDFPARGNLSGYVSKGHKACPICEEATVHTQLKFGKKSVYIGHRRFLKRNHRYRLDKDALFGGKDVRPTPKILTGRQIHLKVKKLSVLGKKVGKKVWKNPKNSDSCPWKKRSIFFDLPYWETHEIRHCLDVMHIEKNVCDSLVGTLLNIPGKTKDSYNARRDLVELGLRPELAPTLKGTRTYLPPGACNLSTAEKRSVCDSLKSMRLPIGYSSNISKCVTDDLKLHGLKSHDCHVLMQQLLPVALRGVLDVEVRYCITRLCFYFHTICRKSIDRDLLVAIEVEAAEILCELELYFPPAFFDIMVHLIVHLVREIRICGPVASHWMYPFERQMRTFKGFAKCSSRPDASIVERFIDNEVIDFCTSLLEKPVEFGVPRNKHYGRKLGVPRSKGKLHTPLFIELKRAHHYILINSSETVGYVEEHLSYLRKLYPYMDPNAIELEHADRFVEWFYDRCADKGVNENIRAFARKPNCTVRSYTGYDVNGFSFSTIQKDSKSTTQSSGVFTESDQMVDGVVELRPFYGVIEHIWELDYVAFKCVVFKCKWVCPRVGVDVTDPMGFTRVDLKSVGCEDDQIILPSQAQQIFFVDDPADARWSIVLQGKKYFFEDEIDCQDKDARLEFPSAFPTLSESARNVGVRGHDDGFWVDEMDGNKRKKKARCLTLV